MPSRSRYAEVLNTVTDGREEVVITRAGHEPVVIVSLEDYESLKETTYLRSPAPTRVRRRTGKRRRLAAVRGSTHCCPTPSRPSTTPSHTATWPAMFDYPPEEERARRSTSSLKQMEIVTALWALAAK